MSKKLTTLADYIEKNPKKFNQTNRYKCVVGLGNRLTRFGFLLPKIFYMFGSVHTRISQFADKYGVVYQTANDLYYAHERHILGVTAEGVASQLRSLARKI